MNRLAPIILAGLLTSCCTTTAVPDLTSTKCIIDPTLLQKPDRLAPIVPDKKDKASLKHLFNVWVDDMGKYNSLYDTNSALIDTVKAHCLEPPATSTPSSKTTLSGLLNG